LQLLVNGTENLARKAKKKNNNNNNNIITGVKMKIMRPAAIVYNTKNFMMAYEGVWL